MGTQTTNCASGVFPHARVLIYRRLYSTEHSVWHCRCWEMERELELQRKAINSGLRRNGGGGEEMQGAAYGPGECCRSARGQHIL